MIEKKAKFQLPAEEAALNPVSVMGDEKGVYFTYRSDIQTIANIVPKPLEVAFPLVSGYIVSIDKPAFTLPYREAMLGVYVKYGQQIGMYPISFLLSGPGAEMATLPGREKFGLPKKMCETEDDIRVIREGNAVRATAKRHGVTLADVSVKLDGSYNNPGAAVCYEGAADGGSSGGTSFYMHPLMEPDETGVPAVSRVNIYSNVAEYSYRSWGPGKVTVRLYSSADDAWGQLPVLENMGGAYSENDLEMKKLVKVGEADPRLAVPKLLTARFDRLGLIGGVDHEV